MQGTGTPDDPWRVPLGPAIGALELQLAAWNAQTSGNAADAAAASPRFATRGRVAADHVCVARRSARVRSAGERFRARRIRRHAIAAARDRARVRRQAVRRRSARYRRIGRGADELVAGRADVVARRARERPHRSGSGCDHRRVDRVSAGGGFRSFESGDGRRVVRAHAGDAREAGAAAGRAGRLRARRGRSRSRGVRRPASIRRGFAGRLADARERGLARTLSHGSARRAARFRFAVVHDRIG